MLDEQYNIKEARDKTNTNLASVTRDDSDI